VADRAKSLTAARTPLVSWLRPPKKPKAARWLRGPGLEREWYSRRFDYDKPGRGASLMRDVQKDIAQMSQLIYSLHRGRSRRTLIRIVPCGTLFKIEWPDGARSDLANLTRCKDAAREWCEHRALLEDRKNNAAQRLNSLNNFWWSLSCVAQNERPGA
jgi:hypothetical protein